MSVKTSRWHVDIHSRDFMLFNQPQHCARCYEAPSTYALLLRCTGSTKLDSDRTHGEINPIRVATAVNMEKQWNVTPCSLADDDTCFGNILHASSGMAPEPWRWRKDVSPKCQQRYTTLHTAAFLMETLCPGKNDRKSNTYCNINQTRHVRITTHDPCRCNSWWSSFGFIGCVTFQRNVLRFSNPKDRSSTFSETSENSATRRTNPQGHHLIKKCP